MLAQYAEDYSYDEVGNIASIHHGLLIANPLFPDWTRAYTYETNNNQLKTATEPVGDTPNPYPYTYNEHGSMTSMAHLQAMDWDFAERLQHVNKGGGGDVYFAYDASGQRTRKVYVHSGLREERIYVGGYEVYRKRVDAARSPVDLERQTVHVMDNLRRVAMVETKTIATTPGATVPTTRWRFQLDNHLGSATLELDTQGNVVSYEEYHPYGTSALRLSNGDAEASAKRYRYTGKERDEETSLYYHGARYYAPWLGRWTASDPGGIADGINVYAYVGCNPIAYRDPTGSEKSFWDTFKPGGAVFEAADKLLNPNKAEHPVAAAILDTLDKRGEALVEGTLKPLKEAGEDLGDIAYYGTHPSEPGAGEKVKDAVVRRATAPIKQAVGAVKGFGHLVKRVGENTGEVAYYSTHMDQPGAKEKIASAGTELFLDVPQLVLTVAGGASALRGAAGKLAPKAPVSELGTTTRTATAGALDKITIPTRAGTMVKVPGRLSASELASLQSREGVEFAQVYITGPGKGGGGGQYYLIRSRRKNA